MARKGKIGKLELLPEFLKELFNGNSLDNGSIPRNKLDSATNEILNRVPKIYNTNLPTSSWELNKEEGFYTTTVTHNLNSTKLMISAISNNEGLFIPFKIIDNNTITLQSNDQIAADLIIIAV